MFRCAFGHLEYNPLCTACDDELLSRDQAPSEGELVDRIRTLKQVDKNRDDQNLSQRIAGNEGNAS